MADIFEFRIVSFSEIYSICLTYEWKFDKQMLISHYPENQNVRLHILLLTGVYHSGGFR